MPSAMTWTRGAAIACAAMVTKTIDVSPFRSPQAAHTVVAEVASGKQLVEIGTRNGDGMECFAQVATKATAIEMTKQYCEALRERSRAMHAAIGKQYAVQCASYVNGVPDADVYTWWSQPPYLKNTAVVKYLSGQLKAGKIRRDAEAVFLYELQDAQEKKDLRKQLREFHSLGFRVAWNRTVEYDEERQCTAYCDARKSTAQRCKTRYGEKCERAKGLFLVLNVPLRGSAAEG